MHVLWVRVLALEHVGAGTAGPVMLPPQGVATEAIVMHDINGVHTNATASSVLLHNKHGMWQE